ncbi:integrase arm-type DNA-binding domain-containing protein [Parasphingorhabdus halotolerans]|uniref:Integrase arm-type DNA-binding domain-containing protein n=1 Tax=Parasphingorhabdus halotolerans TaxID=2725558 RepID=A0A6H2DPG3_9SPHN|nr:integrase arm-type DNA-binding domain-containing protein [Parasphingorhabdus halotolerans]QJB69873.1 integrase arm-type DNA-binding domain-containing protein [Parasphingorhabdus halotolerans]
MALKDTEIRALQPKLTPFKVADGKGLYIEVFPNGSKLWRLKFRSNGKEKRLALGKYPDVTLAKARAKCNEARAKIADGVDPAAEKQRLKIQAVLDSGNTFAGVAEDYIETKLVRERKAQGTLVKARWFLELLTPAIGFRPIAEIEPAEILAPLKKIERKGNFETAKRCRAFASRVFRFGVATARCKADPTALLQGALIAPKVTHHAAITDPAKVGELLRAIDSYTGSPITKYAMQIAPHVFVRPGELRHAEWLEIDVDDAIWHIPAGKMKARRPHDVPLTAQVLASLADIRELTGSGRYIFPSLQTPLRPMSENTINAAFRRMGYAQDELTGHGLRTTASTLLNEAGKWDDDVIETALAHKDTNQIRGTYNRAKYWDKRVEMASWWSDYLDVLRKGAEILDFPANGSTAP